MMTKWNEPDEPKGQKYPNYKKVRTPSGHTILYDDSKGAESISIKHRSGSTIRMDPDGSTVLRNAKDKYEITMGDNRVLITGVSDITVNGAASMKVEGDYDLTVNGNMNTAVKGNYEQVINGNKNVLIKGKSDTAIHGAETVKVKGNYEHTSEGKTYIGSATGLKVESTGAMVRVIASTKLSLKGATAVMEATGKASVKGGSGTHIQGPELHLKGDSKIQASASSTKVTPDWTSGGQAEAAETADE